MVSRSYAPEFRRRVVELVRSGRAVSVVAAEIGVSEATVLKAWTYQSFMAPLVQQQKYAQSRPYEKGA